MNDAVDDGLYTLWQQKGKEFHLYMPAINESNRSGKADGQKLGKHHYINSAEDRYAKQLGPHDIDTGDHHDREVRKNAYPLH
jgi:hypothetical protein